MATIDLTDSDIAYFSDLVSGNLDASASEMFVVSEEASVFKGSLPFAYPYSAKFHTQTQTNTYYAIIEAVDS